MIKQKHLVFLMLMCAMGCTHLGLFMPAAARPAGEQIDWPVFGTPTEVEVSGDLFRVVRIAADDFIPSGLAGHGETPAERCTSSQAAHYYRVVHAPERHLYFVRMGLDRGCAGKMTDWGAEYAIDDRTWEIRGRRIGSDVPALLGPELAALVIMECPTCDIVLLPGEHCTVVVQLSPSAVATRATDMVLVYADAQGPGLSAKRSLLGTGR